MMDVCKTVLVFLALNSCFGLGQFNVQIGYDFGFFTTDYHGSHLLNKEDDLHRLHRLNGKLEYHFQNNLIIALDAGINVHNVRHNLLIIENAVFAGSVVEQHSISVHHSTFQAFRTGLSVGYKFDIGKTSSILFTVNYAQFFFNRVIIRQSYSAINYYLTSDVENMDPDYSFEKHTPMINLNEIGYRNKFKNQNKHIIFSLGYRYHHNDFFINPSLSFSPSNNSLVSPASVIPRTQSLFLFGVSVGYTFPQKNKSDEK